MLQLNKVFSGFMTHFFLCLIFGSVQVGANVCSNPTKIYANLHK